jgi:hypothetical protein
LQRIQDFLKINMRLSLPLVIDQEIANLDEREVGACLFDVLDGGRVVFIGSTFWVLAVEALYLGEGVTSSTLCHSVERPKSLPALKAWARSATVKGRLFFLTKSCAYFVAGPIIFRLSSSIIIII